MALFFVGAANEGLQAHFCAQVADPATRPARLHYDQVDGVVFQDRPHAVSGRRGLSEGILPCPELYNEVDLDNEIKEPTRTIPFSIERPTGHYYLQLRTLLYRKQDEKVFAQAEQFFFGRRPLTLLDDLPS